MQQWGLPFDSSCQVLKPDRIQSIATLTNFWAREPNHVYMKQEQHDIYSYFRLHGNLVQLLGCPTTLREETGEGGKGSLEIRLCRGLNHGLVWASFPNWMNTTMKVERILKEALERAFENHDNMNWTSFLESFVGIGCSFLRANFGFRFHKPIIRKQPIFSTHKK